MRPPPHATLALALTLGCLGGCGASRLLPTTLFHTPLAQSAAPGESDWLRLSSSGVAAAADALVLAAALDEDDWLVWTTDASGRGTIVHARRTSVGLETQSLGAHVGPTVRPTLRALAFRDATVIVVESSTSATSTERVAWLYVERGAEIVPLSLDGGPGRLRMRAERRTHLERGWARAATLSATLEASDEGLVVHEHESVREVAEERPELDPRSTYEVERARTLRRRETALISDRPSLFDDAV